MIEEEKREGKKWKRRRASHLSLSISLCVFRVGRHGFLKPRKRVREFQDHDESLRKIDRQEFVEEEPECDHSASASAAANDEDDCDAGWRETRSFVHIVQTCI